MSLALVLERFVRGGEDVDEILLLFYGPADRGRPSLEVVLEGRVGSVNVHPDGNSGSARVLKKRREVCGQQAEESEEKRDAEERTAASIFSDASFIVSLSLRNLLRSAVSSAV